MRESGAKDVKIVGFDAGPKQVKDLEDGTVQALIAQKPADIGSQGVEQAFNALEGKPTTKKIGTESTTITKDTWPRTRTRSTSRPAEARPRGALGRPAARFHAVSRELLLGLDLGTTSCKAAVVTPEGEEIAHGQSPLRWTPVPTGAEIASAGVRRLRAGGGARGARRARPTAASPALGVSGMAETGVLLDRARRAGDRPRSPGTTRAARTRRRGWRREIPAFRATTGLSSRALRTVAKYRWLRDNVEETARGVRWLSVGEWVVHGLGGEQGAELSLASRTGWLDLHARGWWDETLAWSGAPAGPAARAGVRRDAARARSATRCRGRAARCSRSAATTT